MNKKIIIIVILVVIISYISYLSKNKGVFVETVKVTRNNIANYISEDAKTILERDYLITTPVDGIVIPNEFKEGDFIKKGEIVAKFDNYNRSEKLNSLKSKELELNSMIEGVDSLKIKKEELDTAKIKIKQVKLSIEDLEKQKSILELDLNQIKLEYLRNKKLFEQQAINKSDFEKIEKAYNSLKISYQNMKNKELTEIDNLKIAELNLNKLIKSSNDTEYQKRVYNAQIEQIRNEKNILEQDINKTSIKANFSGPVLEVYLKDKTTLPAGSKLLKVGDLSTVVIQSDILSEEVPQIKIGMPVEINGKALDNKKIMGKVSRIFPIGFTKISALGVEQQRIKVIISFDNKNLNLRPETTVDIKVITQEHQKVLSIPERAIFKDKNKWFVFLVDNENKLVLKAIKIGLKNEDNVEIINGLKENDLVVLDPDNKIKEGLKVIF
ncbi:MAG: efflux RND transporter periplasmic adaptor subunit [Candidatus Sericytochromatia bacterium]